MPVLVGSEPPVVQTKAFPLAINFELEAKINGIGLRGNVIENLMKQKKKFWFEWKIVFFSRKKEERKNLISF